MENELDKAFEALKTYDWGKDIKALKPIDDAVVATRDDAAARKALETRLAAVLKPEYSRDAKDFACRRLMIVGTAASVPALAALLPDKDDSHMARYALERIQAPEAAAALRDAMAKLAGPLKIGMIGSLGARRDAESVPALVALLGDADAAIAASAACALGDIGTPEAAAALSRSAKTNAGTAVADSCLVCAERLLADGKRSEAVAVYKSLSGSKQSKLVRLAATRGLLAASKKSE